MAFEQLTEFDKMVKSALEGVEEAVPSSVWDGIASKLDAIAGAAAAGAAISSVSTGSAASGSAASGAASTAAGSAATGSVASGAAAGTTATGAAAGSAATAAAGGAVAASSNVITIALASVAAAGVIGGGAALVLTNSDNQHIIEQPKQVPEAVVDTTSETMLEQMPEDTIDLVSYVRHQKPVIDETMPVEETEKHNPEKEPESIKSDVPAPKAYKPEVQWAIRPKQSHRRFAISAGYINSLDRGRAEVDFSGVYFGLSYNFPINENMGVAPGIYYSYTRKSNARCWGQYIFYSGAKIQEHYLDFPVCFNYRHDFTENISARAFAGPTFSLGLSSSIEYDSKTYNGYEKDYSRFDVMVGGGVSVEFRKKYGVLIGYDFGLLDKNKEDSGPHHKRNKFYVGVSYMF